MDLYNKEKNSKPNSKASSNGINISFDGYTYDPYFQDKLEPILKELTGLRYFPQNDDFEENTLNLDENGKRNENPFQNNFQLSGTQLIYKYVTWMVTLATTLVTPSSEMIEKVGSSQKDIFSSPSHFLEALQTAGSVFMLNIISVFSKTKAIFSVFTETHQDDPTIINTYFSFVGISNRVRVLFILIMNAITSNFSSFLLGLMLMGFFVIGIIISIPFIFLVVSSMLVASFSITAVFAVNRRVYSIVNDYFPIRDILVYFADRIPPSVGRVEVSHQKQRKDYEARLKAEQEELKNM